MIQDWTIGSTMLARPKQASDFGRLYQVHVRNMGDSCGGSYVRLDHLCTDSPHKLCSFTVTQVSEGVAGEMWLPRYRKRKWKDASEMIYAGRTFHADKRFSVRRSYVVSWRLAMVKR